MNMNVLIVVANPNSASFCNGIASEIQRFLLNTENNVRLKSLYESHFNPLLEGPEIRLSDIEKADPSLLSECRDLQWCDFLVIVHPNWWEAPPAILKGWIDRVFRVNMAYRYSPEGKPVGLLKGKRALVVNTSNTPLQVEKEVYKDPLDHYWKTCVLGFCGMSPVDRVLLTGIIKSTEAERKKMITEVLDVVRGML